MIVQGRNGKIVDTSTLQRTRNSFIVVDDNGAPLCGKFAPRSRPEWYVASNHVAAEQHDKQEEIDAA